MDTNRTIWVVDYAGRNVPGDGPNFSEDQVIIADTHFVLVEATWYEVQQAIAGLAYWKPSVPQAGRWIAASGAEIYLDAKLRLVADGEAVLASLGDYTDMLEHTDADTVLDNLGRTF